jgi:hypothetical protein
MGPPRVWPRDWRVQRGSPADHSIAHLEQGDQRLRQPGSLRAPTSRTGRSTSACTVATLATDDGWAPRAWAAAFAGAARGSHHRPASHPDPLPAALARPAPDGLAQGRRADPGAGGREGETSSAGGARDRGRAAPRRVLGAAGAMPGIRFRGAAGSWHWPSAGAPHRRHAGRQPGHHNRRRQRLWRPRRRTWREGGRGHGKRKSR